LGSNIRCSIIRNKLKKRVLVLILALALILAATSAFAADGQPVYYKSGDETVQGNLYAEGQRSIPRAGSHSRIPGGSTIG